MTTKVTVSVVIPGRTSWGKRVMSFFAGMLALMVVPVAILAIGVPAVLLVGGLIDAAAWVVAMFAQ